MANCGSLLKSLLAAVVLVTVVSVKEEKLASCCKKVTSVEITEHIFGYLVQKPNPPCVKAVIFQTKTGLYCSHLGAPWARRKIMEIRAAQAKLTLPSAVTSPPVSLLSIITATASLPSSSTILPSSSTLLHSSSTILPSSSILLHSSSTILPSSSFSSHSSSSPSTMNIPALPHDS